MSYCPNPACDRGFVRRDVWDEDLQRWIGIDYQCRYAGHWVVLEDDSG